MKLFIFPARLAFSVLVLASLPSAMAADRVITENTSYDGISVPLDPHSALIVSAPDLPTLTLTNEATATWQGAPVIGNLSGETGRLVISNGSTLNNEGFGLIGTYGTRDVYAGYGYIGLNAGSSGSVEVSGTGSLWENPAFLFIGESGEGSLNIENGGRVTNTYADIAFQAEAYGQARVIGANSRWENSGALTIANRGYGSLSIQDGGFVSANEATLGLNAQSDGTANLSGASSRWEVQNDITVGNSGSGYIYINGGATLQSGGGRIATHDNSQGMVAVDGANSHWQVSQNLIIAGSSLANSSDSFGELVLINGGAASVGDTLKIHQSGSLFMMSNSTITAETFDLSGRVNITASAENGPGVYTPITANSWSDASGNYFTNGGRWDAVNHTFTIAESATATSGQAVTVDIDAAQRLAVTGANNNLLISLSADATNTSGDSEINFTVTDLGLSFIGGEQVISAWEIDTDLIPGSAAILFFNITGFIPDAANAWYSTDGENWQALYSGMIFEPNHIGIFTDELHYRYAMTGQAIPEPSAVALLALTGLGAYLARRRTFKRS